MSIFQQNFDIVIIGGGFSGVMTAVNLLQLAKHPIRVALIDRKPRIGRGLAYSTTCDAHLLNVPTKDMSAFPDRPDHFLQFAQSLDQSVTPDSFVPRRIYGDYLHQILRDAMNDRNVVAKLSIIDDQVLDLSVDNAGTSARLTLAQSGGITAKIVVLALGNPSSKLPVDRDKIRVSRDKILQDPFAENLPMAQNAPVLIIGTGLTMVDLILRLENEGHTGDIYCISRHGLLPQSHMHQSHFAKPPHITLPPNVRQAVRIVRECSFVYGWRGVVGQLRQHSQAWWKDLSVNERARFIRHVQRFWDSVRHRMAPEVAARLAQRKNLVVYAGRIMSIESEDELISVELCLRTGLQKLLSVSHIFNCTGPDLDYARSTDPLVERSISQGILNPHPLGFGLQATEDGALVDSSGNESRILFSLGPPLRGVLGETTAVPEIRLQSLKLARRIISQLSQIEQVVSSFPQLFWKSILKTL